MTVRRRSNESAELLMPTVHHDGENRHAPPPPLFQAVQVPGRPVALCGARKCPSCVRACVCVRARAAVRRD
jgi:hypothetical protein